MEPETIIRLAEVVGSAVSAGVAVSTGIRVDMVKTAARADAAHVAALAAHEEARDTGRRLFDHISNQHGVAS